MRPRARRPGRGLRSDDGRAPRRAPRARRRGAAARGVRRRVDLRQPDAVRARARTSRATRAISRATWRSSPAPAPSSSSRPPPTPCTRPATTRACASGALAEPLEGAHRPGHFEGVATVVAKLLRGGRAVRRGLRSQGLPAAARRPAHGARSAPAGRDRRPSHRARGRRARAELAQRVPVAGGARRGPWRSRAGSTRRRAAFASGERDARELEPSRARRSSRPRPRSTTCSARRRHARPARARDLARRARGRLPRRHDAPHRQRRPRRGRPPPLAVTHFRPGRGELTGAAMTAKPGGSWCSRGSTAPARRRRPRGSPARLRRARVAVRTTREPSDGPVGVLVRQVLTGRIVVPGGRAPGWATMALLFAADRMDHVESEIEPFVAEGGVVLSDRYDASSLAYQSVSSGADAEEAVEWIRSLNRNARRPDLTVVLDLPADVAAERRDQRGEAGAALRAERGPARARGVLQGPGQAHAERPHHRGRRRRHGRRGAPARVASLRIAPWRAESLAAVDPASTARGAPGPHTGRGSRVVHASATPRICIVGFRHAAGAAAFGSWMQRGTTPAQVQGARASGRRLGDDPATVTETERAL